MTLHGWWCSLAAGVLLLSSCGAWADDRTPVVSLVASIANPQKYAAKKVLVLGFCSLEFEDTAVYLHEEDYRRGLTTNSIWLDVPSVKPPTPNPVHESHCLVEATFSPKPARNGREGRLERVTRLERWLSRAELEQR